MLPFGGALRDIQKTAARETSGWEANLCKEMQFNNWVN